MPYVTKVVKCKLEKLRVLGSDYPTVDETRVRDYAHAMGLAEGHVAVLDYLTEGVHILSITWEQNKVLGY